MQILQNKMGNHKSCKVLELTHSVRMVVEKCNKCLGLITVRFDIPKGFDILGHMQVYVIVRNRCFAIIH